MELEPLLINRRAVQFDLGLLVLTTEKLLDPQVLVEYKTALFDRSTIERLVDQWGVLLATAVAEPDAPLSVLPILPESERHELATWTTSPVDVLHGGRRSELHADVLIAGAAALHADDLAIRAPDATVTHGEAPRRAEALAAALVAHGVRRGDRVHRHRTLAAMVIALLAIWKAGAAYVPLDPAFPSDRLGFIIGDADVRLVLSSGVGLPVEVDLHGATSIDVAVLEAEGAGLGESKLPVGDGDDVAYVIYTSGSTGMPKGVELEHRNVVNFLLAMADQPGLGSDDVVLAVTTLSFDITVLELFLPLVVGAEDRRSRRMPCASCCRRSRRGRRRSSVRPTSSRRS